MEESTISVLFERNFQIHYRNFGMRSVDIAKEMQFYRKRGEELGSIFNEIEILASKNNLETLRTDRRSEFHGYDGSSGWISSDILTVIFNASSIAALIYAFRDSIYKFLDNNPNVEIKKGEVTIRIHGKVDYEKIIELLKDVDNPKELDKLDIRSEFEIYNILSDKWFDKNDLQDLAFRLGIEWDALAGDTKDGKARSLIKYCARRDMLPQLKKIIIEVRPNLKTNLSIESN